MIKETVKAKPPRRGIAITCTFRGSGKSMAFVAIEIFITIGMNSIVSINAVTPIKPRLAILLIAMTR